MEDLASAHVGLVNEKFDELEAGFTGDFGTRRSSSTHGAAKRLGRNPSGAAGPDREDEWPQLRLPT